MKLSTRGEYGLLAIIDLALHSHKGPVQSFQIAERQSIPKQYLDQLMLILKKAGLVESSRGRQGGYQLARAANTVSILDIITALEGPIENVNFMNKESVSSNTARDLLRCLWSDLFSNIVEVLRAKTLEELCDQHQTMENQIMYYI
ncbi:MAG: Rrf2 family transcriptional regulator [Acidobacteria bacterium]|nr:MAG: Rrf2 family transcriptional regulator [Acidobacteriota bacterium]